MLRCLDNGAAGLAKYAGPGGWNDPDMLEVSCPECRVLLLVDSIAHALLHIDCVSGLGWSSMLGLAAGTTLKCWRCVCLCCGSASSDSTTTTWREHCSAFFVI